MTSSMKERVRENEGKIVKEREREREKYEMRTKKEKEERDT